MRAARTNDVEVMRLLLDGGADPSVTLADRTTALLLAAGQGLGAPRGDGPRIRAPTEDGAIEAVRLLLDRGADINAPATNGNTALHAAVTRGDSVVKFLAERGADITAKTRPVSRRSTSPSAPAGAAAAAAARDHRGAAPSVHGRSAGGNRVRAGSALTFHRLRDRASPFLDGTTRSRSPVWPHGDQE